MLQNNKNYNAQSQHEPRQYILTENELEIIDGLINMLNLAITEVFVSKAANIKPLKHYPIQEKFNEQCYDIIESKTPSEDYETSPD